MRLSHPAEPTFSPDQKNQPPGHVLIVDDMPVNVKLLESILKLEGFQISTALSGQEALDSIARVVPDVVLLDVMMPEMDGFETCRRIRASPASRHLPVVMVTALTEIADRVRALEAGADDFITKPVEGIEVIARVTSLIRVKRGRDALERAYADLRRAEGLRDTLTQMLVHDLRTPLTAQIVALDMLSNGAAGPLTEPQQSLVSMSARGGSNLLGLVNDLLDVARLENGQMTLNLTEVDFGTVAEAALAEITPLLSDREVIIERRWQDDLPAITIDADLIRRVIVNLLSNAVKYSPTKGTIVLGAAMGATDGIETILVRIQDDGCGIPPENHERIWDKFGQAEARQKNDRHSTGLGLTFCKLAVDEHGGHIGVESNVGEGSTFFFSLPVKAEIVENSE